LHVAALMWFDVNHEFAWSLRSGGEGFRQICASLFL
jgi:hypothetical protein